MSMWPFITQRMLHPWDQQPIESAKAFERFALYRDMGAGRSLRKLAKDLELNPSTLAEISKKHDWQERIAAFDVYIDKASQHNQVAQVKAMKRRQITTDINRTLKDGGIFIAVIGSEDMYSQEWLSLDANFPENKKLKSGDIAKIRLKDIDVTFNDFYYTDKDYHEMFTKAGLEVVKMHHPLGRTKNPIDQ